MNIRNRQFVSSISAAMLAGVVERVTRVLLDEQQDGEYADAIANLQSVQASLDDAQLADADIVFVMDGE